MAATVNATVTQIKGIEGVGNLRRRLKALDEQLPREVSALNKASAQAALPFVLALTPVKEATAHGGGKPGALLSSIRVGGASTGGYIQAGSKAVPYAGPIEFGWPRHNIEGVHFLTGGVEAARPAITERWIFGLNRLIESAGL
jgi:hypothetical protein